MQLFLAPEMIKADAQVLNVITDKEEAIGYLAYLQFDTNLYVYGHLQEVGAKGDFHDVVKPYIQGLQATFNDCDLYTSISVGGETLQLDIDSESGK
ncbi:hypothetical protein [Halalkalibacterium halodurans]|uniref:Uncharacterized protein n=1 Tax=Halalkalibacterium halodurans TaxID=86665 RepID=A0A0M0KMU4_ALKHA|nr:hypothetical protein [Halalkalibacterium halodurans]MDY7241949.1 hypothetical protein [Halalkalibacterium halodurans]MED4082980.1 hypothetical protein [Halalkalibacterium halodurans]MED4150608.1 hypothetical protein [Halalkalibacterium halodurans]MED4192669.1 hypothetical protein [Halalkalibacterium halodurans]MED4196719.1 hypothetical protein [Halalkalibacterium halodurans]